MANITLSFQFKDSRFSLCAAVKGTSKRNYKEVQNLVNPNFDSWDKKKQLFVEATEMAIHNNAVLFDMKQRYQHLINMCDPLTGKELFELHEASTTILAKKEITFEEYLKKIISDMRNESVKMPSKNYQLYITLLHKLEVQRNATNKISDKILDTPLTEVSDIHFMKFGEFILKELKGINYLGLMKHFKAVMRRAKKYGLTSNVLEYPYTEDMPTNNRDISKVVNGVHVLTEREYNKFLNLALSTIPQSGIRRDFYKELYRDFCVFIYEMKMRPADVVCLQYNSIKNGIVVYLPTKKKNYQKVQEALVSAPITPKAKSILSKYEGQSSKGYVFPFSMNEYAWELSNADSFNKWNNRKQATLEKINAFLSKVRMVFNVEILTTYTFRHSAFTHEINAGKKTLIQIAKEGGTSVEMLEKHYYNHLKK